MCFIILDNFHITYIFVPFVLQMVAEKHLAGSKMAAADQI